MGRGALRALAVVAVASAFLAAQEPRPGVCGALDRPLTDAAPQIAALGEPGRRAVHTLAASPVKAEALCGMAGLAALHDRRVIPLLAAALGNPAYRDQAYLLARWGAFLAGGREPDLSEAMLPVVEALGSVDVRRAAGDEAVWLLGEVDHAAARTLLLADLETAAPDATVDAVLHALARQGEPRARARIAALGEDAVRAKSGNATPEQARRLGAVAFYQLALAPETLDEGLTTLAAIALRDQTDAASWAVRTLCERAVRRPAQRKEAEEHRRALTAALDARGVPVRIPDDTPGCPGGR